MINILKYALNTYVANMLLISLFSIAFIIAFLIPSFAAFPTYNDAGAIFLRSASVFLNLDLPSTAIIVVATLFSLLFLSFAIVAINVVVKHSRTHTKIKKEVINGLERYTAKVFLVLFVATLIIMLVNVLTFATKYSGIYTAIVGLIITPFMFYAPSSIVIDENRITRAVRASLRFFFRQFGYFLAWLVIAIVLLTVSDGIFIAITGTLLSRYYMLIFSSIFILPFLVLLQGELYMSRFKLLKR